MKILVTRARLVSRVEECEPGKHHLVAETDSHGTHWWWICSKCGWNNEPKEKIQQKN